MQICSACPAYPAYSHNVHAVQLDRQWHRKHVPATAPPSPARRPLAPMLAPPAQQGCRPSVGGQAGWAVPAGTRPVGAPPCITHMAVPSQKAGNPVPVAM